MEGLTIMEHGQSVWSYSKRLISGDFDGMRIPDWLEDNHSFIVNNMHSMSDTKLYNIYHDCGKPQCLEIDDSGRRHFPNHAEVSEKVWRSVSDNDIVAKLIGNDMSLHTLTSEQIDSLDLSTKDLVTLIITSYAEIHSNASMFGGIESTSFKIKWKKLTKRCKRIISQLIDSNIGHLYSYVIVRNDLTTSQKAVQGTHASIEMSRYTEINEHPSVIYLLVKNEKKLKSVISELIDKGIDLFVFREPDLGNELTSLCTVPLNEKDRSNLKRFMLM